MKLFKVEPRKTRDAEDEDKSSIDTESVDFFSSNPNGTYVQFNYTDKKGNEHHYVSKFWVSYDDASDILPTEFARVLNGDYESANYYFEKWVNENDLEIGDDGYLYEKGEAPHEDEEETETTTETTTSGTDCLDSEHSIHYDWLMEKARALYDYAKKEDFKNVANLCHNILDGMKNNGLITDAKDSQYPNYRLVRKDDTYLIMSGNEVIAEYEDRERALKNLRKLTNGGNAIDRV